jgi:hypothetical protein
MLYYIRLNWNNLIGKQMGYLERVKTSKKGEKKDENKFNRYGYFYRKISQKKVEGCKPSTLLGIC